MHPAHPSGRQASGSPGSPAPARTAPVLAGAILRPVRWAFSCTRATRGAVGSTCPPKRGLVHPAEAAPRRSQWSRRPRPPRRQQPKGRCGSGSDTILRATSGRLSTGQRPRPVSADLTPDAAERTARLSDTSMLVPGFLLPLHRLLPEKDREDSPAALVRHAGLRSEIQRFRVALPCTVTCHAGCASCFNGELRSTSPVSNPAA